MVSELGHKTITSELDSQNELQIPFLGSPSTASCSPQSHSQSPSFQLQF